MKYTIPTIIILFLSSVYFSKSHAQFGSSFELGAYAGPASIKTDYGERYHFEGYVGFSAGIVNYINFTDISGYPRRHRFFNQHFRMKNELSFIYTTLEHTGKYVADDRTSENAEKLRAMTGSTLVVNLTTGFEFHLKDISDYESSYYQTGFNWSPYVGIGLGLSYYNPEMESSLGNWEEDRSILYGKWSKVGTVNMDPGTTFSTTFSTGTRFKVSEKSNILLEANWRLFWSDWIDGLNARAVENKYNDWSFVVQVGYIFQLD
ncbi:THC0290_0291 family protein [Aureivirga sp. CE67]|uniref:THC0290_0291 family protein n=1 Tax=Aureivirga sp. CE67 TaxID=1788983 RepID=UPI0018C90C8E|nr:glutamate dehydrogenase [Aureivirga sp. CE67]